MEIDLDIGIDSLRIERCGVGVGSVVGVEAQQRLVIIGDTVAVGVGRRTQPLLVGGREFGPVADSRLGVDNTAGRTVAAIREGAPAALWVVVWQTCVSPDLIGRRFACRMVEALPTPLPSCR